MILKKANKKEKASNWNFSIESLKELQLKVSACSSIEIEIDTLDEILNILDENKLLLIN